MLYIISLVDLIVITLTDGVPETHSDGQFVYIKGVNFATLTGRTIKCKQDDGTILRARVDACLNQHDELRDRKFKIVYDDTYHSYLSTEKANELMTYNDIMNHLHRDQLEDGDKLWKF